MYVFSSVSMRYVYNLLNIYIYIYMSLLALPFG